MTKILFTLLIVLASCADNNRHKSTVEINYIDGTKDTITIDYYHCIGIDEEHNLRDPNGWNYALQVKSFDVLNQDLQ
jgi:hypothetical protein